MCKEMVATRGPDYLTEKYVQLNHNWHGHFAAAILWMQGPSVTMQPSMDGNGNLLLWNGDLFSGCLVCKSRTCVCIIFTKYF